MFHPEKLKIMKHEPTKGDIITTNTGEQFRVLSIDSNKTLQAIEYSPEDKNKYPRIKLVLIEDII